MFTLRIHTDSYHPTNYTEVISRHRTLGAAKTAKTAAEKRNPPPEYALTGRFFITKPVTLLTGTGRFTNAYYHISAGAKRAGTTVTRRRGGYSDFNELAGLVSAGLLEVRYTGPRGGQAWHATDKGRRAIAKVKTSV